MIETLHAQARTETARLRALEQYQLPGAAYSLVFEDLTQLAADLCATPIAGISLIGADAVTYHARIGPPTPRPGPHSIPRGVDPCELCIWSNSVCEIQDSRYHPAYRPDGILIAGRSIRFHASAPLVTPKGIAIGCLFVQSQSPQALTVAQKSGLATLAAQVVTRLELHTHRRTSDSGERDLSRVASALSVERNFVSTVLDTVGALVAVFDTAGRIVRFNRTSEEVSGFEFASLVGRVFWEHLIPQADIPAAIDDFERLRSGDFPASFENHWQHRDGSLRRIAWTATALVDEQGQPNFLIATGIDVTEQRAAESTLRDSEARYRQLVEGSLGMVFTHSLDGTILSVNTYGAESLGRTVGEMTNAPLTAFMKPESRASFDLYLHQIAVSGEAQGRFQLTASSGESHTIAYRNKLIHSPHREPSVLGFGIDISEQVRAEERLHTLIHQSNSILESVGDGIYGVDLQGRCTVINPAASQMLGYKPNELLGYNVHEMIHFAHPDGSPYPVEDCAISASARTLDTVRVASEVFWRKDGTSFPVEYVARPQIESKPESKFDSKLEGKAGARTARAVGVVVAFRDTTASRALDRMKDEFISTVSHELRTPLTSLRAALGLVTGGALETRPEKKSEMLSIAIGNTDRLIRLVNDFLDIERISSGNAELHSQMCSAQVLFDRAASLQQAAAVKQNLQFECHANDVAVYADPDRILQALTNLISNAIKFSPPSGTIHLSARTIDAHEARIDVHDEGRGIPADKLDSIFERFQQVDASDSRAMGGTGLGLAICRSIVTQHGGLIWATSPPGQGATFHFTLPIHPVNHLR